MTTPMGKDELVAPGEAGVVSHEATTAALHEGEVPDQESGAESPAQDAAAQAGAPGVQMREAQESDVAPDEQDLMLIELDAEQIPGRLRVSDLQRVFRAAGVRLRFAVEDPAHPPTSEASQTDE